MKIKTSELQEGAALNWAVMQCEEFVEDVFEPSEYWGDGGPIIELHGIELNRHAGEWVATLVTGGVSVSEEQGPTPLVAAMRCYVASQLGDEIDVPDELCTEEQTS